jgi:Zn-dependent protease with chaperone function
MDKILIESYLDHVQEDQEQLQEFDPMILAGAGTVTSLILIYQIVMMLITSASLKAVTKTDKKMTKKINKIIGKPEGYYKIHIVKYKVPNAFTLGGRHLYYTTELEKIMTEGELTAILLHEVFHSKSLHVLKSMAVKYPLMWVCLSIWGITMVATGVTAAMVMTLGPIGVLLNFIMLRMVLSTPQIIDNILFGKMYEYQADEYAAKYGYGDNLISAFKKLIKLEQKAMKGCEGLCKIMSNINQTMDAHPETKKRIENILRKKETAELALSGNASKLKDLVKGAFTTAGA